MPSGRTAEGKEAAMLQQHLYVSEKLAEMELERAAHRAPRPVLQPKKRRVLGRPMAAVGRRMRRFGEALECWAAPSAVET
jgi:hypothetical protein